ncbi:MAG: SusD/RagB family nutrient-binding outer membrane lipoprotein [Bacteroidota bacterium]
MRKLYNKITTSIQTIALLLLVLGCETTDLSVKESPNTLNPTQADVDFFLNAIQQGLTDFFSGVEGTGFQGMSEFGMEATRMLHASGPSYRELNAPGNFNRVWGTAYSTVLADVRSMTPLAEEAGLFTHIAIGQIIEAYIIITLVDYFGDIPYSDAIQGSDGNVSPVLDDDASVYEAANQLLLDAISNLNREEFSLPVTDLYYGDGNGVTIEEKWIRLANTLRLKLFLQTRLANESIFGPTASISEINTLIAENNLIMDSEDDFIFNYGTSLSAPDSRHPFFEKNYGGNGPSASFIMANYYMDLMANEYGQTDPRIRYYFYRQVSDFSDQNVVTNNCSTQNAPPHYSTDELFCTVPNTNGYNGLWGWDHFRADGIPPHTPFVTMFGVYPAGGPFDDDSFRNVAGSTAVNEGLQGAGISPIMMSSYTYFMLAEAAETLGTSGDAAIWLEMGIRESINTTINFGAPIAAATGTALIPTSIEIDAHVAEIMDRFNGAAGPDRLKVLVQQYMIALWCNGIEAYNTYRRTGQPDDMQPAVQLADPGVYLRSNFYPQSAADNNSNVPQKAGVSQPVFWDTNPEGFVD